MGLSKWLARKGNVGGTARWAVKIYSLVKDEMQNEPLNEKMCAIAYIRYKDKNSAEFDYVTEMISGKFTGLAGLVMAILIAESGYSENSEKNKKMFFDVIIDELKKAGLTDHEILGRDV